jgi:diguanylate cyclase (GGDEF)-like protein
MLDRTPWRELLQQSLLWIAGGGLLMGSATVIACVVSDLPVTVNMMAVPALLGALGGSLLGLLNIRRLLSRHLAAEEQIERLAYTDSLTGLPNRALLHDRLVHAIAQAHRDSHQVGVFFFDLDRFKMINDTQGHAVGDLVLRSVAQRLKKFIREGDTFARLGGDEFVIVQADPNHDPNFAVLARRILETLAEPFRVGEHEFYTTASIGVAVYPCDGADPAALLQRADTAMYAAKNRGRNNFQFFSPEMNAQAVQQVDFETRLRQALLLNQLSLHYQPQYDLASGRIVAVEALIRWIDPESGEIPPGEIMRIAEESGLVYPLGKWVMETAARQAMLWQGEQATPLRIAVNVSGHHIRQSSFIDQLDQILEQTGLSARHLDIELTETAMMGHLQELLPTLTDLKVRGVGLTIDKFGTGYSSLLYLVQLPIRRIKIAPDFIVDLIRNHDHTVITEAIIAIAHRLGLKVTAVGVENADQLEFLRRQGCSEAAGHVLCPPVSADDILRILRENSAHLSIASNS